jgi:peptidoglycan/LPS O-acetylase OafA/YrhL
MDEVVLFDFRVGHGPGNDGQFPFLRLGEDRGLLGDPAGFTVEPGVDSFFQIVQLCLYHSSLQRVHLTQYCCNRPAALPAACWSVSILSAVTCILLFSDTPIHSNLLQSCENKKKGSAKKGQRLPIR